ncbi:MAG: hypothetical protein HY784_16430 [Chloroflexi bacterium]|nr:hypothetical protein [Chloroflexota bacterium]
MSDQSAGLTQDQKTWGMLVELIPPLAIVALLIEDKKNDPFVRYHSVHALALAVVGVVLGTITFGCLGILWVVAAIYYAIRAYSGEWVVMPVLTDFLKKQGWV